MYVDDERPRSVQEKLKQMFDQQSWSDCIDAKYLLHFTCKNRRLMLLNLLKLSDSDNITIFVH